MSFYLSFMLHQLSVLLLSLGGQFFSRGGSSGDFLQDFAVIMIVAAIMLVITHRLKQPKVIGYILAGMIIGPYTPPFRLIHNVNSLNAFAELGIIFFAAQALGFLFFDSLFLALAMSITSTVVTVRVLEELGMIKDKSTIL